MSDKIPEDVTCPNCDSTDLEQLWWSIDSEITAFRGFVCDDCSHSIVISDKGDDEIKSMDNAITIKPPLNHVFTDGDEYVVTNGSKSWSEQLEYVEESLRTDDFESAGTVRPEHFEEGLFMEEPCEKNYEI